MYLSVKKEEKEQVVAMTRRYLDASDPAKCNAIFSEAGEKWGHLIFIP